MTSKRSRAEAALTLSLAALERCRELLINADAPDDDLAEYDAATEAVRLNIEEFCEVTRPQSQPRRGGSEKENSSSRGSGQHLCADAGPSPRSLELSGFMGDWHANHLTALASFTRSTYEKAGRNADPVELFEAGMFWALKHAAKVNGASAESELLEALSKLLEANSYYFPVGNPWGDRARAAIARARDGGEAVHSPDEGEGSWDEPSSSDRLALQGAQDDQ